MFRPILLLLLLRRMSNNYFNTISVFIFLSAVLFISSCKTYTPVQEGGSRISVLPASDFDSVTYQLYAPYKILLEGEMRKQVATLGADLVLEKPESNLGTLVINVLTWQIQQSFDIKPDFCFYNFGGIRTPSLTKGPLYVEDAYRLLPFDNMPVMMEIDGKTANAIFQTMALDGGWPLIGAKYHLRNGIANEILINGQPIDTNRNYVIGTIDFLALGGDNMSYLKQYPSKSCNILMRDVMLDYWKKQTMANKEIHAEIMGNVIKDE